MRIPVAAGRSPRPESVRRSFDAHAGRGVTSDVRAPETKSSPAPTRLAQPPRALILGAGDASRRVPDPDPRGPLGPRRPAQKGELVTTRAPTTTTDSRP